MVRIRDLLPPLARGSVKRVAAAVGEGSVAIGAVHRYLAERP